MATEIAELIFKADSDEVYTAYERLNMIEKGAPRVDRATRQVGSSFGGLNNVSRQLGYQLQDVAVQLQGGQNAMLVLSQQGSQLASVFGPGGAILGAIIAVSGALGGSLLPSLFDTSKATEILEDTLDNLDESLAEAKNGVLGLSEELKKLAQANESAARAQITETLLQTTEALDKARAKMVELTSENGVFSIGFARLIRDFESGNATVDQLTKAYDEYFLSLQKVGGSSKDFREFRSELAAVARQFTTAEEKAGRLQELMDNLTQAALETDDTSQQKAVERITQALEAQATALLEGADSTAYYKAQQEGATEAELERIKWLEELIASEKEYLRVEQEKARAAEQERRRQERLTEQQRKAAENSLETLRVQLLDEEGVIEDRYKRRLEIIQRNVDLELITKEDAAQLEIDIERKKQAELDALADAEKERKTREFKQLLSSYGNLFGDLSSLMSSESRDLFEIGKAASIANALVKGVDAAISSYAFGASIGGPLLGGTFATLSSLATGALIGQLEAASPPGRAQGGQVRPGQRYRVGEYGPEDIIMGSNGGVVVPPAANDSAPPIEVVNNIRVIGAPGEANVSTQTTRVSDRKFVQDIVVEMMSDPSSRGRQGLQRTSNVLPKGSR